MSRGGQRAAHRVAKYRSQRSLPWKTIIEFKAAFPRLRWDLDGRVLDRTIVRLVR